MKRDASDRASRIVNLLTSDRSTTDFEVTPEVNRHSHVSQYRSLRDRSSSVEDRDISPEPAYHYTAVGTQVAVAY